QSIATLPGLPRTRLFTMRVALSKPSARMPDDCEPPLRTMVLLTRAGPRPLLGTRNTTPPLQAASLDAITFWMISASETFTIEIVPPPDQQSSSVAVLPIMMLFTIVGVPAANIPIALPLYDVLPTMIFPVTTAEPAPRSAMPPPSKAPMVDDCE